MLGNQYIIVPLQEIIKMNYFRTCITSLITCSFITLSSVSAQSSEGLGLSVKGGTLGAGVEISASLLENTRLRGGINYLSYNFDSNISDVDYDFETKFNSLSLLLDWHPFSGSFFFSGGALINNNSISAEGTIDQGVVPAYLSSYAHYLDMVSVSGDVEFSPIAPYLGIGWRSNNGESGWGVACELGVLFQGEPDVSNLRVNSVVDVNDSEVVQQFLAEQEAEIEDELSYFKYYPVASLLLIYNF